MLKTKLIAAVVALGAFAGAGIASAQYYDYNAYYQYPQVTTYGSQCPALYSNLTLGSRGSEVQSLQSYLMSRYGDTRLTGGYYGQLTVYYVQRLQQELGVYPATGGVGPITRAAIQQSCGGSYGYPNPGYPTYPTYPSQTTFRLDRNFTLDVRETAQEYRGELTITLNRVGSTNYYYYSRNDDDSVNITLGLSCRSGTQCFYYPQQTFTLEEDDSIDFYDYEVELVDVRSDRATFRITDEDDRDNDDDDATINLTSPSAREVFEQGDDMDIEWDLTEEPNTTTVLLELYDEDDDRVGAIAIVDGDDGDFEWDIPERGDFCTQQYPNGLCGFDLDGEYYIKATLYEGNGTNGDELDEDESPVFEIED